MVGILLELHTEFDAVLLSHLAALNTERAAEEKAGKVRWLRPGFQDAAAYQASQTMLSNQELPVQVFTGLQADLMPENSPKTALEGKTTPQTWPSTLPAQVSAIANLLASANTALSMVEMAAQFKGKGAWKKGLPRILETLEALGRARREGGWRGL